MMTALLDRILCMVVEAYFRGPKNLFKLMPSDGQMGTKEAEINYLKNMGAPLEQIIRKPFSHHNKLYEYIIDVGQIFSLLPPSPAKVIDFGCGTGWTSEFYAQGGYKVTGLDISDDMISTAQKYRKRGGKIDFMTGDYEFCSFNQEYDAAVFYDSLHHSLDEIAALNCAYNSLKDGGRLIIVEPGAGHGTTDKAMETNRKFGTTERPMPPHKTVRFLREIGFKKTRKTPRLSILTKFQNKYPRLPEFMASMISRAAFGVVVAEK
jgi:SAM-dependent methyltransferase